MDFSSFFYLISISVIIIATEATNILCPIQSLFQLGDSVSDTGNLVRVLPVGPTLPASKPPYGETFPGRPTGRWSDGRLIIDYTAMALGIPLLNPYLDKNASFRNRVNFAVAGATALNSSFFVSRGIIVPPDVGSLDLQLRSFHTYLASICSTPRECSEYLRRALVFVGRIGGNDINYPLTQGRSLEEIRTYVPLINQAISDAIRDIIRAGASRVVVPGNFPIGCFPYILAAFASNDSTNYDELGCVRSSNNLVVYQNNNLQATLNTLRKEFPGVAIIYADYYNAFLTTIRSDPPSPPHQIRSTAAAEEGGKHAAGIRIAIDLCSSSTRKRERGGKHAAGITTDFCRSSLTRKRESAKERARERERREAWITRTVTWLEMGWRWKGKLVIPPKKWPKFYVLRFEAKF